MHRGYFSRGANHMCRLQTGRARISARSRTAEWVVEHGDPQSPLRGQLLDFFAPIASASRSRVSTGGPRPTDTGDRRRPLVDVAKIDSDKAQRLGWRLHVQGRCILPDAFNRTYGVAREGPEPFGYWKDVTRRIATTAWSSTSITGRRCCTSPSRPGRIPHLAWRPPDSPPRRRESFYVEVLGARRRFSPRPSPPVEIITRPQAAA